MTVRYAERVEFPAAPVPRRWRGNLQVAAAAWGGVLAGFVPGIALDLPVVVGILIGVGVGVGILALPSRRARRAPLAIEVADGELRLSQGSFARRVPAADIRRVSVLHAGGGERRTAGYGPVFGRGLRWTFEVPDPALGMVRIDRGRGGLDLDVATARPEALARALRDEVAR